MEKTLIIEIGTEEVPARFIKGYAEELKSKLVSFLAESRLSSTAECEVYYTPRRVVFIKEDVKIKQEDETREVLGPPVRVCFDENGNPLKALNSFLQKYGITGNDFYKISSEKGEVIAAKVKVQGKSAFEILNVAIPEILMSIKFKKSMRWESSGVSFVRPIRWILALLGSDVISFEFAGVKSGRRSYGNFNVDREGFICDSKEGFLQNLKERYVIYNPEERRDFMRTELRRIFSEYKADDVVDENLLEEVVNLLEYPVTIVGNFDNSYLTLPPELLEIVQIRHQRYFPLKKGGAILPYFVAFANNPVGDKDIIREGMEKVLKARLNDAVFFYNEDKKKDIRELAKSLNMVLYLRGLGGYDKKSLRVKSLAEYICLKLGINGEDLLDVILASELAKADLVSQTVGEFPELQGIMGKYFALNSGLSEKVAVAIEEHYRPVNSGGVLPQTLIGQVVAIADKIDHLAGLFIIDQKPTASSDPYGARRAASGIVEIFKASKFKNLSICELVDKSIQGYNIEEMRASDGKISINPNAKEEILEFLRTRIKTMLVEEIKPDVAEAILNAESGIDDISSIFERKEALREYIKEADFEKFAVVYKRASNITNGFNNVVVNPLLFEFEEERELYKSIEYIRSEFNRYISVRDYFNAMRLLRENLYNPIFKFFDKVFVMVDDENIRSNRLALLKNVVVFFRKIIDLSYVSSM
ncbi:MAG: glycine--tRNA ligase subunit beta [Deltaproteobacteria bacterium]|nr:glycine--tRNA ligase subunit beta [Deltaproteobacteria bacterium]